MHTQKAPSFVQTPEHVKTPRPSVKPVEHPTQLKILGKTFPSLEAIAIAGIERPVLFVNAVKGVKGNWVWKPKCPVLDHVSRVPRENNMYNVDLKNIVPSGDLTCLFVKATLDESNLWHRRIGHINFKTMNKLVKGILVRGLPSKVFENNHTCVACKKGKQHRASWSGPTWLFNIDTLTQSMNYQPVVVGNQPNSSAGVQEHFDTDKARKGNVQQYVLFPLWSSGSKDPQNTDANATFEVKEPESEVYVSLSSSAKTKEHDDKIKRDVKGKSHVELSTGVRNLSEEFEDFSDNSINRVNAASTLVTTAGKSTYVDPSQYPDDPYMPALEDITYSDDEEDVGAEADFSNLETNITVIPILITRVHKNHHFTQIIGDLSLAHQTRSMIRMVKEQGGLTQIDNDDFHTCMFACFLYQEEPKRVHQALKDPSWIEAMQEKLLQFKLQKVWVLVDLPKGGIIYYKKVFAPVARIEAIRLFLAYASFMGFMVYQMDFKSDFLYGTIEEEVYVCQPLGFEDPDYPDKVYKVVKALYGLHQAPRAWYETLDNYLSENDLCKAFEKLMEDKFQMSSMGKLTFFLGLQLKQKQDVIFISQDKYVAKILRKFGFTDGKSASTLIDTEKPILKDPDGEDVDVHTYRSMIGSLMYLTSSRPDIMFAVCACACFQATPKASHLHAVKRILVTMLEQALIGSLQQEVVNS
nr:hypothetical protein [Tanacetum cinerariifolium]